MANYVSVVEDSFHDLEIGQEKSVDVVITDPPYSAHCQANQCSGSLVGKQSVPKIELPFAPLSSYEFAKDLVRMARRWVLIFCTIEELGEYKRVCSAEYVRGCVWVKTNAMGQLTADRPATSYEAIAVLHRVDVKKRWNGRGSYGVWVCPGTRGKKGRHPNEKPVALMQKLVALFSEPGECVYDPFAGSGAIGEAALSLGRDYVGLDSSVEWVNRANRRLESVARVTDAEALTKCAARGLWTEIG